MFTRVPGKSTKSLPKIGFVNEWFQSHIPTCLLAFIDQTNVFVNLDAEMIFELIIHIDLSLQPGFVDLVKACQFENR